MTREVVTSENRDAYMKQKLGMEDSPSFEDDKKYHQKVHEITYLPVSEFKRLGSGEVHSLTEEQAKLHFGTKDFEKYLKQPIDASVYSDGNVIIQDGHHRVAAAKLRGIEHLPVKLQAINAKGKKLNELLKKQPKAT